MKEGEIEKLILRERERKGYGEREREREREISRSFRKFDIHCKPNKRFGQRYTNHEYLLTHTLDIPARVHTLAHTHKRAHTLTYTHTHTEKHACIHVRTCVCVCVGGYNHNNSFYFYPLYLVELRRIIRSLPRSKNDNCHQK